jgi:NAD(P)-dependent dehydrogenase (short-subunit alcohol dehydrogenase family)
MTVAQQAVRAFMGESSRSILITGACGDIGRALAEEFAASGPVRLALCDLSPLADAERFVGLLQDRGATALYQQVDVTDPQAVASFVEHADRTLHGLDICIGNAGIVERGPLIDLPVDAWRRTLDVNLTGCFLTAQAAARAMKRCGRGGHILFISSWTQDVPRATIGAYCASKGGVKMLAKTLALELGPDGIRVNLIAPGFVDAGLTGQNLRQNPQRRPLVEAEVPLGALISAQELARTVRLFCSDDAAYVTGTTLVVDGGASLSFRRPT